MAASNHPPRPSIPAPSSYLSAPVDYSGFATECVKRDSELQKTNQWMELNQKWLVDRLEEQAMQIQNNSSNKEAGEGGGGGGAAAAPSSSGSGAGDSALLDKLLELHSMVTKEKLLYDTVYPNLLKEWKDIANDGKLPDNTNFLEEMPKAMEGFKLSAEGKEAEKDLMNNIRTIRREIYKIAGLVDRSGGGDRGREPEDLEELETKISLLDPLTKTELINPVQSRVCKHFYSKASMIDYLDKERKAGRADDNNRVRCPHQGCKKYFDEDLLIDAEKIVKKEKEKQKREEAKRKRQMEQSSQMVDEEHDEEKKEEQQKDEQQKTPGRPRVKREKR